MPSMEEIYQGHSAEYDELVDHEDYRGNLTRFLESTVDWRDKTVYEAGVGTGRVTKLYIDEAKKVIAADRSSHMLAQAERNLAGYGEKLTLKQALNEELEVPEGVDIFIEGWSFGHTFLDYPERRKNIFGSLFSDLETGMNEGGSIILIETLGTCVEKAGDIMEELLLFFDMLEIDFGFDRNVVETDYRFEKLDDAVRVMGFFFGQEMADRVKALGSPIVKEYTGVWLKRL